MPDPLRALSGRRTSNHAYELLALKLSVVARAFEELGNYLARQIETPDTEADVKKIRPSFYYKSYERATAFLEGALIALSDSGEPILGLSEIERSSMRILADQHEISYGIEGLTAPARTYLFSQVRQLIDRLDKQRTSELNVADLRQLSRDCMDLQRSMQSYTREMQLIITKLNHHGSL